MEDKINKIIDTVQQLLEGQNEIKGQLDENTQYIKSLVHWTEELDAKYENLLHTTATIDSIKDLEAGFEVLNERLFTQEKKIQTLVRVK